MAVDKAVDSTVLDGYFEDIADSIRTKAGTQSTYTPAQMSAAIDDIPSSDLSEYFEDTIQSGTSYQPGWIYSIKKIEGPLTVTGSSLSYTFKYFQGLSIPTINGTSNVTDMSNMFDNCRNIQTLNLSYFDTSNVTNMSLMFSWCSSLKNLNMSGLDLGKLTSVGMFSSNNKLTDLIFGYDLGKGFLTTAPANYSSYTLYLSPCPNLTHDSLMSVINGLYNIASAGVQPQQLILGSTNLAKLTAAEIAIATNKGWTVS